MTMLGHQAHRELFKQLADSGNLAHGYLFGGPEGIGKRTFAYSLGSYLEGQDFEIPTRALTDYLEISSDETGKIGIAQIRAFQESISGRPVMSQYRVGVVNDAHTLTEEAQDALLKTAEEMPEQGVIILVTSDPLGISQTLRSRLQHIDFTDPIKEEEIAIWLNQECGVTKKDSITLAKRSFGRPGLAWRMQFDIPLKERLTAAQKLLSASSNTASSVIKEYLAEAGDNFQLSQFLDAMAIVLSWNRPVHGAAWHKLMKARELAAKTAINPRIHLLDIIQTLSK